jgi:probable HAF family extracellular repeat protein
MLTTLRRSSRLLLLALLAATPLLSSRLPAQTPPNYVPSLPLAGMQQGFFLRVDSTTELLPGLVIANLETKTSNGSVVNACFTFTITNPNGTLITVPVKMPILPNLGGSESQVQKITPQGYLAGLSMTPGGSTFFADRIDPPESLNNLKTEHPATATIAWVLVPLDKFPNTNFSEASGINESRICVGTDAVNNYAHQYAVMWDVNGNITDLNTIDNNSTLNLTSASAINNAGQIVGATSTGDPFLFENGTVSSLGDLGGGFGSANDINNSGQIVGQSYLPFVNDHEYGHAFLDENGNMTDLGTLNGGNTSSALAINDSGLIIGYANLGNGTQHAVIWETNGTIYDLNNLVPNATYVYTAATSINSHGDIYVQAETKAQDQFGIFLTLPSGNATAPVITTNPGNIFAPVGGMANFTANVTGSPTPTEQWYFNKTKKITGATGLSYMIAKVAATNAGNYTMTATNSAGNATTIPATLTVVLPPKITTQPKAVTVLVTKPATFSVVATAPGLLGYQWQVSTKATPAFTNLASATTSQFTIASANLTQTGNSYHVIVTNTQGGVPAPIISSAVKLTVKPPAP